MKKKSANRINGSLAIYYGIGLVICAIGGIVALIIQIFKALTSEVGFSMGFLVALVLITIVCGLIGYTILKVGFEELDE